MSATNGWAPVEHVMELNGNEPFSDEQSSALDALMERMNAMTAEQRVVVFQILGDFFCDGCGIEQPPGDCQCRRRT